MIPLLDHVHAIWQGIKVPVGEVDNTSPSPLFRDST